MITRRDWMTAMGLAGLAAALPRPALAQGGRPPLFLAVHAGGGWDPTSFCDPKGQPAPDTPGAVNRYLTDDIRVGHGHAWAPFADNDAFFQAHGADLLVLNGVDVATNGHDAGTRHSHSGDLGEDRPSLAALAAAGLGPDRPLPYLTFGGYDATRGLVGRTRVSGVDPLARIAYPNQLSADQGYHRPADWARIRQFQRARAESLLAGTQLPRRRAALADYLRAHQDDNLIARMIERLPDLDGLQTDLGRQGAIALAAWQADLTVSASLQVGGFDTHADHDRAHAVALTRLTQGLSELFALLMDAGVADRAVVMVGSDFGRTPWYNDGNGKDHWPVSSVLLWGAGIRGGRTLGGSTPGHHALGVDPQTLAPVEGGVPLTPGAVHHALRAHLGLAQLEAARRYPVVGADLPLLG